MKINYWETNRYQSPVMDFILAQPPKAGAKIQWVIDLFEEQGLALMKTKFLKSLKGCSLYELKVTFQGFFYRILLIIQSSEAWLLSAFKKKSNNTPVKEIKIALAYANTLSLSLC